MKKSRQRSLRKTSVADDDDEDQQGSGDLHQPVTQAADMIASRRLKKKEARKAMLLGATTGTASGSNKTAPVDIMAGRRTDEYNSISKMNQMAKEMNVVISGSFRKGGDNLVDDGRVSMGFREDSGDPPDNESLKELDAVTEIEIPDGEAIRRAKQKREMIRSGELEYIPIDDGQADHEEASFDRAQIEKGMRTMMLNKRTASSMRERGVEETPALDFKALDALELADKIVGRLDTQRDRAAATLKQHEQGLVRTEENLIDISKSLLQDESILNDLSDEFEKAQEMRGYMAALCAMLHEKSPIIEELQHQCLKSKISRKQAIQEFTELKSKEMLMSASKGVEEAMKVLLNGGSEGDAAEASSRAIRKADEYFRDGHHIPVELDEFGRDLNMEKRALVRNKGLFSLMDEQETTRKAGKVDGDRQKEIQMELDNIFSDVDDDFASLIAVRDRLEAWKSSFSGQYDATFMALSVPALFAPFVRLDVIAWNPLDKGSPSFTKHRWYSILFDYGAHAPESDPDHRVVPSLVAQVVQPWVTSFVRDVWDPADIDQCRSISNVVEDIMVHCVKPASDGDGVHHPVAPLIDAVSDGLRKAIDAISLPSWPPSAVSTTERAQSYHDLMFQRSIALLACVCQMRGLVPHLGLDSLMERLCSSILQLIRVCVVSAPTCAERIAVVCETVRKECRKEPGQSPAGAGAMGAFLGNVREIAAVLNDSSGSAAEVLTKIDSILNDLM
jgi:hypothetical protein